MSDYVHELKTDPEVFDAVARGDKTYEIRRNDRNFLVGDMLILHETRYTGQEMSGPEPRPLEFTGRTETRIVSHVLEGYGLQPGWAILSFAPTQGADSESLRPVASAIEWIEETCAAYCIPKPFAIVEALEAARATPADHNAYPDELTPELREVLGWPNFKCGPFAHLMVAAGAEIKPKAEDEQAAVLHWLIKLVLKHGDKWNEAATADLSAMRDKVAAIESQRSGDGS